MKLFARALFSFCLLFGQVNFLFSQTDSLPVFCGVEGIQPDTQGMNRNITVPANTSIHVTIFLHHCLNANGSGGMTQQQIQDMIDVTYQDFLPHNIILDFEQCQETIRDDANDPYFDQTDQQPFESIAGKYACNSYGIDVFILPDDFLHNELGASVGGGTALTLPSTVLFIYGKTNCAYPSLYAYQNNTPQHFASVPHVLSHELGHCLGLIHTHDPSNLSPAPNLKFCVDANCDWVTTTVPAGCVPFQSNSVTINPANQTYYGNPPFLENIMAYTNYFDCSPAFTTWQGDLMRFFLSTHPLLSQIGHQVLGDQTITGTETWSPTDFFPFGNVVVNGSIDIESGGELTISQGVKVRFREEDQIIVNPGGALNNQGTLTSSCCSYWQGVDVLGGTNEVGTFQGESGSVIEHAVAGVHSIDGGEVFVENGVFRNNEIGVKFWPNKQKPANSFIRDCIFITSQDESLYGRNIAYPLKSHIFANGYKPNAPSSSSLEIERCSFVNTIYDGPYYKTNLGIYTNGSNIYVSKCQFEDFRFGIHALNTGAGNLTSVDSSLFRYCQIGYYGSSMPTDLYNNTFELGYLWPDTYNFNGPDPMLPNVPDQFGVFVKGATPLFVCQYNKFNYVSPYQTYTPSHFMVGIYTKSIGKLNHVIYQNQFDQMDYGNIADGVNANNNLIETQGLHYICNKNFGPQLYDFAVTENGVIRNIQAIYYPDGPYFISAGNNFSYSGGQNDFSDFYNIGNVDIRYYYDDSLGREPLDYLGLNLFLPNQVNSCIEREINLPKILSDSLLFNFKENYRQNYNDYLQSRNAYNLAVYESDSAKITANLLKSIGFKESSDFINSNIILGHLSKKYHADSARLWIGKLNTLESDYFVADFLSERYSYLAADSFLYNVSQSRNLSSEQQLELTQLRDLIDIIKNKYVFDLDSLELVQLRNCATSTNNFASSIKYNLLSMVGVFEAFEYTLPSGIGERDPIVSNNDNNSFLIRPNPTFGKCYIQIPEDCTPCVLQIFDVYGKIVLNQPIESENNDKLFELELDTGLPNLLFWKLNNKDRLVSAGKLLFVK